LKELIQQNDHQTSQDQLNDQQEADTRTEIAWLAIEASEDKNAGLTKGEDDCEEFLGGLVQFAVGLEVEVDIDEVGSGKQLSKTLANGSVRDSRGLFTWKTMPEEMIGVVPNSINVPRLLANIIRSQ
jgi:hypothetical protein